jgi:hypothetical protein
MEIVVAGQDMGGDGQAGEDGFEFGELVVPPLFREVAVQDDEADSGLGLDGLDDRPQSIGGAVLADVGVGNDREAERLGPQESGQEERSQDRGRE